jgi:CheY-like chemotaxis protein/HPt (histidine-containing phosphotransfer) domain-containing protein
VANISHELRTPLGVILGMTELALLEDLSPKVRDYLQTAKDSAEVLLRLLNDILDFSKMDAGGFALESCPFRLRAVLDETMRSFSAKAREKGLVLACDLPRSVPDALVGDPVRLRQILTNLLGNALKFTERGEVVVRVSVAACASDEVCLQFAVCDTGIGISPEDQGRIFAPFAQGDSSTTRIYGGTGLGLAIVSELVSMMGGRLWLESEPGRGSTFYFTARFPQLADQPPPVHPWVVPLAMPQEQAPHPLRVLLVEDTRANQEVVKKILERRGHRVEVADDGREALRRFQQQPFDVVLMDLQMPGMDGFQATEQLRALEGPRPSRVPIVAMTAHALSGDRPRCLAAGMDGYLAKPVHAREVVEAVEQYSPHDGETSSVPASPRPCVSASSSAASASSPAETAVFRPEVALERLDGSRDLLHDVVEFFFEDSPELLEEIHAGLEPGDGRRVERAAHSLKGLSANLEAPEVVEAARRLEQMAHQGDLAAAGPLIANLDQQIARLKEALNDYFEAPQKAAP